MTKVLDISDSKIERIETKKELEVLFHQHYGDLVNFVNSFLNDALASEEVVQDLFFNLWQKRNEIEFKSSVRSYLYSAARNQSLNVLKHISIRESYKVHNEAKRNEEEQQAGDTMEVKELEERISSAIAQLPESRQKIFVMSRYEGKKYREIAEELDISVKTVEAQMGKALAFLKGQLQDYLPLWLWLFIFFER